MEQSKYSIWARHIKNPRKFTKDEPMLDMEIWCVKTACYYYCESPSDEIACDVKLFASEEAAVRELNRTIREDWTSEIEIDGETKSLADLRGMQQDEGSRKYSDWYYSEDGKLAWHLCDGSFSYRGEVVKLEVPS